MVYIWEDCKKIKKVYSIWVCLNLPKYRKNSISPGDEDENLAVHHKKVQEGVAEIMGGQILELECVKQWNARFEEGREKGETLLSALIQRLFADARTEDIKLVATDENARKQFYKEYGITF